MIELRVMVIVKDVASDTHFVVANPKEHVAVIFGCVFIQRVAIPQGQLNATVIFIELEVDHAGNRIRPVGGGSAIFQNLDALDSRNGNAIQIDESAAGVGPPRKRGDTAAIDQKQRSARVETAQRNRRRSHRTALTGPVIRSRNTTSPEHRLNLEKRFRGGALTRLVNQVAVETKDRIRTDLLRRRNIRTSHDHALDFGRGWRSGWSSTRRRWWRRRVLSKCARCEN